MVTTTVFPDVRIDLHEGFEPIQGEDASSDPAWSEHRWLGADGTFVIVARQAPADRPDADLAMSFGEVLASYERDRDGSTLFVLHPTVPGCADARGARVDFVSTGGEPLHLLALMGEDAAGTRVFVQVVWPPTAAETAEPAAVALVESVVLGATGPSGSSS